MGGNGDMPAGAIRGRYLLIPADEGGAHLHWSVGLCDRCLNCGCGDQRLPFDLTRMGAVKTYMRLRKLQADGINSE